MQLLDRIEKRRFVGREFLMWLWFESEIFDATLQTAEHGSFGLWIEQQFVLSAGKEGTRIKGAQPAHEREAKESVLRGKLPESAGLHLSWGERELSFSLKAETLGISRLKLPTVLDQEDDTPQLLDGPKAPPRRRKQSVEQEEELATMGTHESFHERMQMTHEFEAVVEALYRDFLQLRLSPVWSATVLPTLNAWLQDQEVDAERYRAIRTRALGAQGKSKQKAG